MRTQPAKFGFLHPKVFSFAIDPQQATQLTKRFPSGCSILKPWAI